MTIAQLCLARALGKAFEVTRQFPLHAPSQLMLGKLRTLRKNAEASTQLDELVKNELVDEKTRKEAELFAAVLKRLGSTA
ncbi:MAG: hypothetical protein HY075_07005 [Deltaproteobacteria bacterium]|nr:hypothetical protein [Deltaproteobacteria bacterium]